MTRIARFTNPPGYQKARYHGDMRNQVQFYLFKYSSRVTNCKLIHITRGDSNIGNISGKILYNRDSKQDTQAIVVEPYSTIY